MVGKGLNALGTRPNQKAAIVAAAIRTVKKNGKAIERRFRIRSTPRPIYHPVVDDKTRQLQL